MGSLPSEIGRWSNIQFAAILEASLTGTIPSELGRWTSCHTFFLKGCLDVSGTLPTELGLMEGLQLFHVFGTPVSGTIPSEIGLLTNALDFFFHTTELSGTMPEEVCALPFKDLSANCLPISPELPPQVECDCCTDCFAV